MINLHRAIKGSNKQVQDMVTLLIRSMGAEFVKQDGKRFITMSSGILELLENGLFDIGSLIQQRAIDIANATTSDLISVSQIKKLMAKRAGPLGTVPGMIKHSNQNVFMRVANQMARLNAEGYGTDEIRKSIIGTAAQGYSDGVMGRVVHGSETMMRTAAVMANETARDAQRIQNKDAIGYIWVSVLDGRTTLTCAALNGHKYYYADSGVKPLPPQHAGCRSSTSTITKSGGVPEVETLSNFIKNNPDQARDMLGATRYQLVTDGKLRVDRFVDRHFTPLTVEQLREKNAVAFKRIGK